MRYMLCAQCDGPAHLPASCASAVPPVPRLVPRAHDDAAQAHEAPLPACPLTPGRAP